MGSGTFDSEAREAGEPAEAGEHRVGPTDFVDPLVRHESRKAFVWIGTAALFALTVYLAQSLLVVFGGVVFAAMIDGGARMIGRVLPVRRSWRVMMVLGAALLFLLWMSRFAGSQIADQASELPTTLEKQGRVALDWLAQHGMRIRVGDWRSLLHEGLGGVGGIGQVTAALGGLFGALTTVFLIVVLGIYFALEPRLYQRGVGWMLPRDRRDHYDTTTRIMAAALRRLLMGRVIGMTVEGLFTWVMLQTYGVPMAALLALITGLLAFLPNIGAPISGALMIMVGFSGGAHMGLYTVFVYLIIHLIDGYLIVPMIARKTVDLPPALVLAAQLIMGVLFGLLGLVFADPLVAMIKIWLEREASRNDPGEAAGA